MKQLTTLLLALALSCFAKAQKVYVPDANVRTYLQSIATSWANYVAVQNGTTPVVCFDGDSLIVTNFQNTTWDYGTIHPLAESIQLPNKGITTMEGMQYIMGNAITSIDMSHNLIDSAGYRKIPAMTNMANGGINLSYNKLVGDVKDYIYSIDASVVDLSHNNISKFSTVTFTNCQYLQVHNNLIAGAISVNGVVENFHCQYNKITAITNLSNSLITFNCSNNFFTALPSLPNSILYFNCSYNNLTGLPPLPNSLINFLCLHNQLIKLPSLPNSLQNLSCSNNELTLLPALPSSLTLLYGDSNNLYCLPLLPAGLTDLLYDTAKIKCLPNIPSGLNVYYSPVCNASNNPYGCQLNGTGTLVNYVNIPDTNFGKFLIAQYPSCLYKDASNLYWMDTTCAAVVNETSLYCSNKNIKTVEGIQYFKQLRYFNCSHNSITSLPAFKTLYDLDCGNNLLTALPNIDTLGSLACDSNQIAAITQVPLALYALLCQHNLITTLPQMPSLQYLNCSDNLLTSIPYLTSYTALQPTGFRYLDCRKNDNLHCLPILPLSLQQLFFDTAKIPCLLNIPTECSNCLTINGHNISSYNYPVCNASNNTYGCTITPSNYVYIPDNGFRAYLVSKIPACFNITHLMDTTCAGVLSLDSIKARNYPIQMNSFEGLQYLKGLQYFDYWQTPNPFIPQLPANLKSFTCQYCDFDTFPALPASLVKLDIKQNLLKSLPTLPSGLQYLDCTGSLFSPTLKSLPALPNSLDTIICQATLINSLPTLPTGLKHLDLLLNFSLNCLPTLPTNLSNLLIENNIACLPNKPSGISSITTPICNATNNPNNCPTFSSALPNYVNIPDTNFGKELKAQYPSCLYKDASNLYWMDTTCSGVNMALSLHAIGKHIKSIEGIQYFKHLKVLTIYGNQIDSIAKLPPALVDLECYSNGMKYISNLPATLKMLGCYSNQLTSLPNLPPNLGYLNCIDNQITQLPSLPNAITDLFVSVNPINSLPTLPTNLQYLQTYQNNIQCLPALPSSLIELRIDTTKVKCLPNFVAGLKVWYNLGDSLIYPVCSSAFNPNQCSFALPNYVNIPDTNFGKFLIAQYPSCLYKDASNLFWMDTTCAAVVNDTVLFCVAGNVSDLTGIQYFKSLKHLSCHINNLTWLPNLPNTLLELNCSYNLLTTLPSLPSNINTIWCFENKLTNLPTLSNSLQELVCRNNRITTLPTLPNSLITLNCGNNLLTALPNLPLDLKVLECNDNQLSNLPNLNDSLTHLLCGNNSLTSLPYIPQKLTTLLCDNNQLTSLPLLPYSLHYLRCSYNNIFCLPLFKNVYDSTDLVFDGKKIKCLPIFLPFARIYNPDTSRTWSVTDICNPTNNPGQCQIYPRISGKVFTDNNSNSSKDANEFYRPFVKATLNNGQYTYSNLQGAFGISLDTFGTYTLKITAPNGFKAVTDSVNVTFTQGSPSLVIPDIALQPISSLDSFAIKITALNRPRPGFAFAYNISYANAGTISSTINNTVTVALDTNIFTFDSVSTHVQAITTNNNGSITTNPGQLAAGQYGSYYVYGHIKPTVAIGTKFTTQADIRYGNTTFTKAFDKDSGIVTGSYDPNDKQATPTLTPQQVTNGEFIDYIIRFQNLGTDTAIHVVIADTFSNLLQYNQIQVVATSHNANVSYKVSKGIIYFEFRDIYLPHAAINEPLSHGFVRFRLKPLNTLALGAVVPNNASIYFDYNSPVVTNTATTTIKATTVPVKIISYSLQLNNPLSGGRGSVLNNWSVANEINVSHYLVQRSSNGVEFNNVGEMPATGSINYQFIDNLTTNYSLPTTLYYRLKIIDKDGIIDYSPIKSISFNKPNQSISISPNPSKGNVSIDVANGKELLITDYLGRTIITKTFSSSDIPAQNPLSGGRGAVTINNLQKGIYMVKLIMNNGEVKTGKLIVE